MDDPYKPPASNVDDQAEQERTVLLEIARRQKHILWLILASIFTFFVPIVQIIVSIVSAIMVFRLAKALYGTGWAIACCILLLIPLVGLIVLVIVNASATRRIRAAGFKVGLMGAPLSEVEAWAAQR